MVTLEIHGRLSTALCSSARTTTQYSHSRRQAAAASMQSANFARTYSRAVPGKYPLVSLDVGSYSHSDPRARQ